MKYLVGIISVLVVVVLVGSVMVPIINDSTNGSVEYEDNPDWDGWVRFDLNTSAGATYHLEMSQDDNGIYVENIAVDSRDTQIYDDSTTVDYPTIMYADSNTVIWSVDDTFNVQGKVNGSTVFINAPILDITRDSNGVEVVTDTDTYLFDAPTWAYVPLSQGKYGFYPFNEDRGVEHPANAPTAVLGGGNVGVWAYNNSYTYDGLGLVMNPIVEDGMYYGATWVEAPEESIPDDITITPLDPSVIGGGDADLNPVLPIDDPFDPDEPMSVPTPTYTDGDWGYDLVTVDGVQKANIVAYLGTGGDIVVPSTVGGYTVNRIGKYTNSTAEVFTNSSVSPGSTITFSEGISAIGYYAFRNCTNFTGPLVFPNAMTVYGNAFAGCTGFTGTIDLTNITLVDTFQFSGCTGITGYILPSDITVIPNGLFNECTGLTGDIIIPDTVEEIKNSSFTGCTGITGKAVIPTSVNVFGGQWGTVFYQTPLTSFVMASECTPGNTSMLNIPTLTEFLDLSDTIDYSVDRYGIPNSTTVYDTIGDCFGFISAVSIAHNVPGAMGQYSNLVYVIPIVIIASLLVAFAATIIRRDY